MGNSKLSVGTKPLLAKTCKTCGIFRDAKHFVRRQNYQNFKWYYDSECISCLTDKGIYRSGPPKKLQSASKCYVDTCPSPAYIKGLCNFHKTRADVYEGNPTPIKICFGCKAEFVWSERAFKTQPYCDPCIKLLQTYIDYLPTRFQSIYVHNITAIDFVKMLVAQDF